MPVLEYGDPSEDLELIPKNDQVNVMLTKVEENNFEYNGEEVKKLRWYFTVKDDGPWKGKDVIGDTSQKFIAHPECKAYNWAAAIMGQSPSGPLDTDDLVMMNCRVLIDHKTSSKTGRTFMKVKDVMPPRSLTHDASRDGEQF